MSEYQYYEFRAIDRPLGVADQKALRGLSTRARITERSFTNSYEWGDFKGDPEKLMEQWFDLHIYWANWGTRRLMIRLPARLADRPLLEGFLREADCAQLRRAGDNLILDIRIDPEDFEYGDDRLGEGDEFGGDDDSYRLTALAPLRADVLAGDLRLFYLIWLMAVEADVFEAEAAEPLPGIGPLTPQLEAFAAFFGLDPDLVEAAGELSAPASEAAGSASAAGAIIAAMSDAEKTGLLMRVTDGDTLVGAELQAQIRNRLAPSGAAAAKGSRTVGDLRVRAAAIASTRERAAAEKRALAEKQRAEAEAKARRARLDSLAKRGDGVWREIEAAIMLRNPKGYDTAASLLTDLCVLADEQGTLEAFAARLEAIRQRHSSKGRFLERVGNL